MTIDCKFHLRTGSTTELRAIQNKQTMTVYMLHAGRCLKSEETQCTRAECSGMKELLLHVKDCKQKKNCEYQRCTEVRRIASHWRKCGHRECAVCGPIVNGLRKLHREQQQRESGNVDMETDQLNEQSMLQDIVQQQLQIERIMAQMGAVRSAAVTRPPVNMQPTNNMETGNVDSNNNEGDQAMELD